MFAGVLNKDGPGAEELRRTCSQRLSLLHLDITNPTQVKEAYLQVSEKVQKTGTAFVSLHGILIYLIRGYLLPVGFIVFYVCRLFPPQSLWAARPYVSLFSPLPRALGSCEQRRHPGLPCWRWAAAHEHVQAVHGGELLWGCACVQDLPATTAEIPGEAREHVQHDRWAELRAPRESSTTGKAISLLGINAEEDIGLSRL